MESTLPISATVEPQQIDTSRVTTKDSDPVGADFARIIDSFRQRSEAISETIAKSTEMPGLNGRGGEQIKQLVDLYNYAVDTQLLVRTSSQLTTGVRQLMTGQ